MKLKISTSVFILFFSLFIGFGQSTNVVININSEKATDTISRHIYGHFAEHLGRCIYEGIYVGEENKTIPNTEGVRNDIIAALKGKMVINGWFFKEK